MNRHKKHLANIMKTIYTKGYITIRDGNISYKPKDSNFFLITAGGIKKNEMTEEQVIKVNFESLNSVTTMRYSKNSIYKPSREINMHGLLQTHKANYNKNIYVLHSHSPNIISFMGLTQSRELNTIKNYFPEINVGSIGNNVPFLEAGSKSLATMSFQNLYEKNIVGLERHGTLSVGSDIHKLVEDIETLEFYTNIFLKSCK